MNSATPSPGTKDGNYEPKAHERIKEVAFNSLALMEILVL